MLWPDAAQHTQAVTYVEAESPTHPYMGFFWQIEGGMYQVVLPPLSTPPLHFAKLTSRVGRASVLVLREEMCGSQTNRITVECTCSSGMLLLDAELMSSH